MPWEWRRNRLPKWHDHPLKVPKKVRDALAPLQLVTRKQWGAMPNNDESPMDMPVKYVRYVHTATEPCTTKKECVQMVRDFQTQHMREGLADINWNFIVGGDGRVYEGRGWDLDAQRDYSRWQHVEAECLDIAYVGKYSLKGEDIPEFMQKQAEALVYHGVDNKHIDCCYTTIYFNTELMP